MEYVQKLTELQNSIGYVAGSVSPVAILGLFGEAGEVANECGFNPVRGLSEQEEDQAESITMGFVQDLLNFIDDAKELDNVKKKIRNGLSESISVGCNDHENAFNVELADLFYYLNAVAIGRGLSLDDLARISYEKVMRKRVTIGPEIPGK